MKKELHDFCRFVYFVLGMVTFWKVGVGISTIPSFILSFVFCAGYELTRPD